MGPLPLASVSGKREGDFMHSQINKSVLKMVLAMGAASQLLACTQEKMSSTPGGAKDGIFSDRPIGAAPDLYVITLSSPPLLSVAKKTAKGLTIADKDKQALLNEQAVFETALKQVAPEAVVIYRYRMTVNGMAVFAATDVQAAMQGIAGVRAVNHAQSFARPQELNPSPVVSKLAADGINSVNFIGGDIAHQAGFTGKGVRVGIIDTGIDYTHSMLGGSGQKSDYAAIDPSKPNSAFPNKKVVGGKDFVGTDFDAASPLPIKRLPQPDDNPIDEAGHGSHVAGTIAGVGDGINTYSGVAPDAQLYALKVFGKEGSTADASVIAAFEFAADPNGDLNPEDHLDVVNLSLGGDLGQPQILYTEAVRNLSQAGTVVVASAGNSGKVEYIVGAPSTADDALSVAASIDGSDVNWEFAAARFVTANNPDLLIKEVEGDAGKPIAQAGAVAGTLVDIGLADQDLSADVAAKVAGHVALIQRGVVSFGVKLARAAAAGAIGAVVYNNTGDDPIPMGRDGAAPAASIPGFMISQALGVELQNELKAGPISVQFQSGEMIKEPQDIDTITSFSSRGPRSQDNLIKPEISAPGQNITSVAMGTGNLGVKMDGTSMASPHMTGTVALIKQAHRDLSSIEVKSLVMNTAKILPKTPITAQGAGRVQIAQALASPLVSENPSLSLGRVELNQTQVINKTIELRNLTDQAISLVTITGSTPGMTIDLPKQVSVPAQGKTQVNVRFTINAALPQASVIEIDGRIGFNDAQGNTLLQIPALAVRTQASQIKATLTGSALSLSNSSANAGLALAFNLLGQDAPKPLPPVNENYLGTSCDLESAGYRIISKTGPQGPVDVIQFAFKLYQPVTTWATCSVSVLVDVDGDGVADEELGGVPASGLSGVKQATMSSALIDSGAARSIRLAYEKSLSQPGTITPPDYTPAVLGVFPMITYDQSTLAIIEAPLAGMAPGKDGFINIKLASQSVDGSAFEADKYLGAANGTWMKISPKTQDQAYYGMAEVSEVLGAGAQLSLNRGNGKQKLVMYYPLNTSAAVRGADNQQQVF
jgi:minor extracellular serine protease Vpr